MIRDDIDVFIHLGLHKTASTFLQKVFFKTNAEALGFVDIRGDLLEFRNYIIFTNELDWDSAFAAKLIEKLVGNSRSRLLLSEEMFCGNPYTNCMARKMIIDRLNELFPKAKYIVVLRNQKGLVNSLYLQYVKRGGVTSLNQFLYDRNDVLSFSLGAYLNFDAFISYLVSIASKQRVKCLLYEEMLEDPEGFISELLYFIGVSEIDYEKSDLESKVNESLVYSTTSIQRFFNKISKSTKNPYNLGPSILTLIVLRIMLFVSRFCKNPVNNKFISSFVESKSYTNSFIKSHLNRDISKYGY